jgi:hypothetical protein
MSDERPKTPANPDEVFAEAYRSYLRTLKEGLEGIDIDALDLSGARAPQQAGAGACHMYTYSNCQAPLYTFSHGPTPLYTFSNCQAALFTFSPVAAPAACYLFTFSPGTPSGGKE